MAASNAGAQFTMGANGGGIDFAVKVAGAPVAGAPLFGANGELLSAGSGYRLTAATAPPAQFVGGGIAAPSAPIAGGFTGTANPAIIDTGQYGAGFDTIRAATFPGGAGVFWPNFMVRDNVANGFASINDSRGFANFTTAFRYTGVPGAYLAVRGTLGNQPGAFVEAAIFGTFTINDPLIGIYTLGPAAVVIASDGTGPLADGVFAGAGAMFGAGTNNFLAYGVNILPRVTMSPGSTVRIDGTLSLIADPQSFIGIDLLPPDILKPDFGAFASVPEPGTYAWITVCISSTLGFVRRRVKASR